MIMACRSILLHKSQHAHQCSKAGAKARKQNAAELKAVTAKKKGIKESMDEVKAEKRKMGTALKIGLKAA